MVLLVGDLNAHHHDWPFSRASNHAGILLNEFLDDHNLTQLVTEPTRVTPTSASCLDFVITNVPDVCRFQNVLPPFGTADHGVVVSHLTAAIDDQSPNLNDQPDTFSEYPRYRANGVNWTSLNDFFSNIDWQSVLGNDTTEDQWLKFKIVYFHGLSLHSRPLTKKGSGSRSSKTDLSKEDAHKIHTLAAAKRREWRKYNTNRISENQVSYVAARNDLKRFVRGLRRHQDLNMVSDILQSEHNPKRWHSLCKSLYIGAEIDESIPQLDYQDEKYASDAGKADLLNRVFTGHGDPHGSVNYPEPVERNLPILDYVDASPSTVEKFMTAINASKSDGPDNMQNMFLKNCAQSLCVPFSIIFQLSLITGVIPSDWKHAIVTPIFKNKGSKSDPLQYRPISITSAVGKLLERIINAALRRHLLDNNLISQSQFGFLPGHSATDQIAFITHKFLNAFESKKVVGSTFLDLSAAFDTVPHDALRKKLPSFGIRGNLYRWLSNFLCNRSQSVKVGSTISGRLSVTAGVPQGCVLAPTLFIMFMNDLAECIDLCNNAVLPHIDGHCCIYADDTMVYTIGVELSTVCRKLNLLLRIVEAWGATWGMRFNPEKTVAMVFSKRRVGREYDERPIVFCRKVLTLHGAHKHLGVTLSSDLSFKAHIEKTVKTVASQVFLLKRLACRIQTRDLVREAYVRYVRPYFEYGAPILSSLPLNLSERLEKLQRRAIRIILNLPYRYQLTELHYDSLKISPLSHRRNLASACYGYKLYHKLVPRALHTFCPEVQAGRSVRFPRVQVPGVQMSSAMFDRSPVMHATRILNKLPPALLQQASISKFKSNVWKNHRDVL